MVEKIYFTNSWDPTKANLENVKGRIDWLTPGYSTPIIRSMMDARADFKARQGFKTMVVLTDGMDNHFEPHPRYSPKGDTKHNPGGKLTIPQFLVSDKGFGKSDIAVRVVGFQLQKKNEEGVNEEELVTKQFKKPLEKLAKKGKFYLVQRREELIKTLRESLRQRLTFTVEDRSSGQVVKQVKGGKEVSRVEQTDDYR